jgi:hypothetical protein
VQRFLEAIGEDEASADATLSKLTPSERAALRAMTWFWELSEKFDRSEAAVAAIQVGLALIEEIAYRADEWARTANAAASLAKNAIGNPAQPTVNEDIFRLAAGYDFLWKVLPEYDRQRARIRGKRKRGRKKPITRSIERLAAHCEFSFECMLIAIERLIALNDGAAQTDDDEALLDLAHRLNDPLVRFSEIDRERGRIIYDSEESIAFRTVRNTVARAKKFGMGIG